MIHTIQATCASSIDAREYFCGSIGRRQNSKRTTVHGDGGMSIERNSYHTRATEGTSYTTTIQLSKFYTTINVHVVIILRLGRVNQDVGTSHEGIKRLIVSCPPF